MERDVARTARSGMSRAVAASLLAAALCGCSAPARQGGAMEWVRLSPDGRCFCLQPSGRPYTPWGFNYDHDANGTLLEDYWHRRWPAVEGDFREMRRLGANVVRIHLQLGRFMAGPAEPNQAALDRLGELVVLAEREGLYLNVTGLGCYHKADVPAWYDTLDERRRWEVQGRFWEAVARRCAASPAIFCYDLMNEPVVPGGTGKRDDWLGPPFAGKCFVQFIALETAGRKRPQIARAWTAQLVAAIRKHDRGHLVTVGLVPWSLDRPGLTSGFVPSEIASELDFLAIHIYPERGNPAEAMDTLRGFAACGKPVVIEEIFPLMCGLDELGQFIDQSRPLACGWIGFYWGKPPEELRPPKSIGEALTLQWLEYFANQAKARKAG